ncbi:MAG: polyketide cyclase [Firmicutes bacterium]|nr:polyketide cyclase [Bacillota bacterium]
MIKANIKKEFSCSKELLWNIVTNNLDFSWRSDLSHIEIVDETHFIEYAKNQYPISFTITKKEPIHLYQFDIENSNMVGSWTGIFQELEPGKILLDFTEELEVKNPIMKLFAKQYLKRQQKKYMEDLEKKVIQENQESL